MNADEKTYATNHRHQQFLILGGSLCLLLMAAAPRQERSLFIVDGPGIKAFGADIPLVDFSKVTRLPFDVPENGFPRGFFARAPRPAGAPAGRRTGAVNIGGVPDAPAAPGFIPDGDALPAGGTGGPDPTALASNDPVGGSAFPFAPPSLGAPSTSPVGGAPGNADPAPPVPVATATPTPTPTTTPTPTPTQPIVPAVPEPAVWLMLITGFGIIGGLLRGQRLHRPSSVRSPRSI